MSVCLGVDVAIGVDVVVVVVVVVDVFPGLLGQLLYSYACRSLQVSYK